MTDNVTPSAGGAEPAHDENLVPAWLALLVLVLIIAVVGVGGFVVRGMLTDSEEQSPTKADIREFTSAVNANPGDVNARLSLAFAYQQDAQYQAALAEYDKVLQQDPKSSAAYYNKGVIYMTLGDASKGEAVLREALEIDPGNALAAKELGEYYAAKGQYRSLLVAVKPAVEAKPTMADLQYLAGLAYEKTGNPELAKEHYRLALRYAPDMQEARDGLRRLGEVAP